ASGGIQGDVLATDNNTVGMGDAGIKSAIQGSNVPNPDEAVPSFVSGAMPKAGKGLLEGTLRAGTSAVSDKLLGLVGLGGKSAADKGKDTRDYLAAAFPELNDWERAGADAGTFKKSFTSFSHSTRNKTRDGLIRVRNIRALNGRFNTSITHAYSIVIGSKHITLNATGGGFLTASKQFRHGATSKSRSNTASNSTKHKSPHLSGWRQIISLIT